MGETNPNGQQGQAPPPPSSTAIPIHTAAAAAAAPSRGPILPPAEQLHQLQFCIHSNPTWPEAFILAFQHYIVMLGTIVMLSSVLVPQMGGNHGDKARVIQTFLFMSGINTLLQTFIGTRLPVVMNPSFAFVIPVMTIIKDFSSRTFLDEHERFVHTMRAIQGALIVASFPNIVIGYSKAWGHYSRFFSPVVIVPVVCVVGIGLFERGFPQVGKCVEIGLPMLILLVIVQQYMKHIHEGAYFLIERFGLLACITIVWAFAGLLTVSGAYNNVSLLTKQHCRTDRSYLMSSAPWIKIPYPFQWGPPIFVASHVFGMMGAALVSSFESTGAYYAGARLAGATPPPAHVLSRSIGLQGVGMLLEGIFGAAAGSTASVENIGLLGLTRIGSRRVVQISTGFMILFSIFGKFGAFFASIPLPIFAAIYCVLFGLVAAVGVSFIQFANNNSLRNLYIIGLSLFLGISVPQYFKEYTVSAGNGPVKTNAGWNEIEAAEKRQKLKASASGQDGVTGIEDLETDPIAEVFGPDTKSRCRAISFISSAKQVKIKQAAMTISSQNKENPDTLRRLDKLENMVSEMFTYLKSTQHSQNQFFGSGTSRTEMRSNSSVHISTSSQNLNPNPASPVRNDGPTLGEKQKVILLGREREEVAKGVIAPQTICHGRVLQDDEKIVWVDEVLKPEATIYDGPQNGLSHLCEIADGGFVIWSIKRIRYM